MIEPSVKNYSQNFVQSSNKYNILISNEPKILLVFNDIFQKFELLIDELRKKEGHHPPFVRFGHPCLELLAQFCVFTQKNLYYLSYYSNCCNTYVLLDILFLSNHNIHKSSAGHCLWSSDPLIERF